MKRWKLKFHSWKSERQVILADRSRCMLTAQLFNTPVEQFYEAALASKTLARLEKKLGENAGPMVTVFRTATFHAKKPLTSV
jgi:hypothetical protein